MVAQRIVDILQQEGLLQEKTLSRFRKFEESKSGNVLDFCAEENLVSAETLPLLRQRYQLPIIDLNEVTISTAAAKILVHELCLEHELICFQITPEHIYVAMADTEQPDILKFLEKFTGRTVIPYMASRRSIHQALRKTFEATAEDHSRQIHDLIDRAQELRSDPEAMANETPIISLLDQLLAFAVRSHASDLHVEPTVNDVVLRMRIDGLLHESFVLPQALRAPLLARIKLLSHLRLDEHNRPQDGRFSFNHDEREIAVRVSIAPTVHGEKAALRLLSTRLERLSIDQLGLSPTDQRKMKELTAGTNGLILVTGPTGSGKTTTLYSILNSIRQKRINISTIEDPVEYHLPGVNQMQVNPTVGFTFSEGLRSILRQDPDVILVGEIRDRETAQIAINAALTGHLVLATLHTNSAAGAVPRLEDMGVEPFLIASTLRAVIGQRLVRMTCKSCLELKDLADAPKAVQNSIKKVSPDTKQFATGRGCGHCRQTGFAGRVGMFELIGLDEKFHDAIMRHENSDTFDRLARQQGTPTLFEDGARLIAAGTTTPAEVVRVTA